MARLSILDRFRPVGAPGPAGSTGVPADDAQGPAAELAPVFAALADDVAACTALVETARVDAAEEVSRARERGAAVLAHARLEADSERAAAAAKVSAEASTRDAEVLEQARREAAALEEAGLAQMPALVGRVMEALLAPSGGGHP